MDPRPSGHSRPEIKSPAFRWSAVGGLARYPGARPDDAHVTPEHIQQLRQLVHRPFPQPAPDPRDAIIVLAYTQPAPDRLSSDHHRAKFVATKIPPPLSHAILDKQNGPAIIQLDRQRDQSDERREKKQNAGSDGDIEESLYGERQH